MCFPPCRRCVASLGVERLHSALGNVNLALSTTLSGPGGAHRQTRMRSWRDVATSIPTLQRGPVTWDPSRMTILHPTDVKWTTMTIFWYNCGEALWGLFPMGGKNDKQFRLENIVCLSTGAFKIQLSATVFEYMRCARARPFSIGPFGAWVITSRATPPGSSLVVTGIPNDLDEMEVATTLVVGIECMLPEPVR